MYIFFVCSFETFCWTSCLCWFWINKWWVLKNFLRILLNMLASKEALKSWYWLFCWICLRLSCRFWVINSWLRSFASSYSGCSASCSTRSSIVSTRWSHNYARSSTRIKLTSFKTRRRDLNWSGSKIFQVGLRSWTHYLLYAFVQKQILPILLYLRATIGPSDNYYYL